MGRNGLFQIILDLFKLLTKELFFIPKPTITITPIILALIYFIQLAFSQLFVFNLSLSPFNTLDSTIIHYLILVLLSNILFLLIGFLSQSRYAIIGTARALVHVMSLDIFITIIYSLLIFLAQSANFHDFILIQNIY